jgi:hypothetical protein
MPPRGRGRRAKLGARGGKSYSTANEAQSPATESSQGTQPEDNTEEIPDELQSDDTDASSKETVNSKAKQFKLVVAFSPEEEQDMVEWLESNLILYNRKLSSYKETVKKEKLWSEKAVEMGKTVDAIKIWYASLRSRYGKLKKKRSGSGDMELTERDEWVVRNFEFLRPHIYEVPKKTTVSVSFKFAINFLFWL